VPEIENRDLTPMRVACGASVLARIVARMIRLPRAIAVALLVMAAGVLLSGLRDLYVALGLPGGGWPWTASTRAEPTR